MHRFESLLIDANGIGILTQAFVIGQPSANKATLMCQIGSGHFRFDGGEPNLIDGYPFAVGTVISLEADDMQFFKAHATANSQFAVTYECPEEP